MEGWLRERTPPVPDAFGPWMRPVRPAAPASVEALAEEALEALAAALDPGDLPRRGAFRLLAADAFVTYACEAALEEEDPVKVLDTLVRRLTE